MISSNCLSVKEVIKTPEYKSFKEHYPDYDDGFLVDALQAYREKYRKDKVENISYYPTKPAQFSAFTTFIRRRYIQESRQGQEGEMSRQELVDTYSAMSAAFTPRIRRFRVNMIVQDVLDKIREELMKDTSMTVRQIIKKLGGYKHIVTTVFQEYQEWTEPQYWMDEVFDSDAEEGSDVWNNQMEQAQRRADEIKLVLENRGRLAAMAAPALSDILGVPISADGHVMDINLDEEPIAPTADEPQYSKDQTGEDDSENAEMRGDRYVDPRILKVEKTLTETVKLFISGIPLVDDQGNEQTDDLGYPLYMTYQQVAYALKEEFETVDAKDFMDALQNLSDKYPWITALYDALKDDINMQAVFFTTFKAYESIYKAVYARKGQYITDNMNARSNKRSLMQEAGANGVAGRVLDKKYSIYDGGGYLTITEDQSKKAREELDEMMGVARLVRTSAGSSEWSDSYIAKRKEKYPWIEEKGRKSMDMFLASDGADVWLDKIVHAARGIGLNITKDNLKTMARKSITKKSARFLEGNNRLVAFVGALSSFYKKASDAKNKGEDINYLYSVASDELKIMSDAMSPAMKKETDRRAQVGETSYSTWNVGGFMQQLCAKLFNKGESMSRSYEEEKGQVLDDGTYLPSQTVKGEYEKWIDENFLKYEQFVLRATGKPIGWLREMYDDRSFSKNKKFELQTELEFMGVSYDKLSDDQRRIAPFVMWYNEGKGKKKGTYAVMIQADYTNAWDYIKAPIYDTTIPVDRKLAAKILGPDVTDEELDDYVKELEGEYGTVVKSLSETFMRPDGSEVTVYADIVDKYADEVRLEYERIVRLEERENQPHTVLKNYEKNGKKFLIFPAFEQNGFREKYEAECEKDDDGASAADFLNKSVVEQLEAIRYGDIEEFTAGEVSQSPYLPKTKEDEMFESVNGQRQLTEWGYDIFSSFSLNDYYARVQMANLFFGGIAFFKSIAELEKRSMLLHGPRSAMYIPAGKEFNRVAYIGDDTTRSKFIGEITELAKAAKERGLISERLRDRLVDTYESIKSTDGQGLRTLPSHREFRKMNPTSQWTDAHEAAYQRIMNGNAQAGDVDLVLDDMLEEDAYNNTQKPFTSGWEEVHNPDGTITRVPLIHKYSEAVILPPTLLGNNFFNQSTAMQAFNKLNELLEKNGQQKIDLFLFESNVKIEPFSVLRPFAVEGDERKFKSSDEMAQYMYDEIQKDPTFIHTISNEFTGVAASLTPHVEDREISFSAQAEKQAKANITDSEEIKLPGRKVNGKKARDMYDQIEEAIIIDAHQQVASELRDPNKIKDILQDGLAEKSYNSADMASALTPVRDGKEGNGRFAVPLFSASLEHNAAELLNSIVKNRLTKVRTKGANIVQVTSVSMDQQAIPFADEGFVKSDKDRLGIEFEYADPVNKKGVKRVKWIDCYIALNDSRLEAYTDPDGSIPPAKLRKLVKDGVIDERTLMFLAYRTPSDAEHSILPLKIKGFLPKSSGANIVIAKEAMKMTGHDYDGDKLRCHFQEFRTTLDIDRLRRDYKNNPTWADAGVLADLFGAELKGVASDNYISEDDFIERVKHLGKKNRFKAKYVSTHLIEYDFSEEATPFTGKNRDHKARANALIQILFGALTSESGSMRLLIPGGAEEHDMIAKTFYITKSIVNPGVLDILKKNGLREDATLKDVNDIYRFLMNLSSKKRDGIIDEMEALESPFSYAHQVRAYRNMMTGTQMTGIYAMYSSTAALLQSLDLHYIPKARQKGAVDLKLFGRKIDKLFDLKYGNSGLQLLIYAELVNAAVDNGKNPILGYINQTPELASLTFMLYAMGLSAEQIHLVLNQPAVVELQRRVTRQDSRGLALELNALIEENKERVLEPSKKDDKQPFYSRRLAIKQLASAKEDQYIANLPADFSAIRDKAAMKFQLSVLCMLDEIRGAAEQLTELVHVIRPEARANGVGPTNAKTLVRLQKLEELKALVMGDDNAIPERLKDTESVDDDEDADVEDGEKITTEEGDEETVPVKHKNNSIRISGMEVLFQDRDIYEGMSSEKIYEEIEKGSENGTLRQVIAYHNLYMRWTADFMANYFPMMKPEWRKLIVSLADEYDYKSIQEGAIQDIAEDMVLYALLDSPRYKAHLEDKRSDLVIDLPKRLEELKQRIEDAKKGEDNKDEVAKALADNMFLAKLDIRKPESPTSTPRIFFDAGGPVIGDMAEDIRQDWSELLSSPNKEIRKLAIDLFEYNMFTSGFGYGRYEFAHLAPLDVILDTPGYTDALYSVMEYDFGGTFENFRHQYYMNHWGNKRLVPQFDAESLGASAMKALKRTGTYSTDSNAIEVADLRELPYIVVKDGDDNYTLYRNISSGTTTEFEVSEKLGVMDSHRQMSVQYAPQLNYREIKPIQVGVDSNWGDANELSRNKPNWKKYNKKRKVEKAEQIAGAGSAVEATAARRVASRQAMNNLFSGQAKARVEAANAAREEAVEKNETPENNKDNTDSAAIKKAYGALFGGKKMFNLVRMNGNEATIEQVPATPNNIRQARKMKAYVMLDRRLRDLLARLGYSAGVITSAEARAGIGGVTDLDTARVVAEELVEAIRVANGYVGMQALPEEVAHLSLELLGHDHPLVHRLLNTLRNEPRAVREAFGEMYDDYMEVYDSNPEMILLEAAGKLVAKQMLRQQRVENSRVYQLVRRIIDGIKSLLKKIPIRAIQDAIYESEDIASQLARDLLSGQLAGDMSRSNISVTGQMLSKKKKDISQNNDIVSKILKHDMKLLEILEARLGYTAKDSPVIKKLKNQITELRKSINNHKTESAVLSFLDSSLAFLMDTESDLNNAINNGLGAGVICKQLSVSIDTLHGFAKVVEAVKQAIRDGEIERNEGLEQRLDSIEKGISKFFDKCDSLGMDYFEDFLTEMYGPEGLTQTIGRQRGRQISIREIATRGDRDVSLFSRWIHSASDCNDLVLKAVAERVRRAKWEAREETLKIKQEVDAAFEELKRETGSSDQTFMFQYKTVDGKRVKTGKYITKKAAEKLPEAQRNYYNKMMDLKERADKLLPENRVALRKIVMLRKLALEKARDSSSLGEKGKYIWESIRDKYIDMSDDALKDTYEVKMDFEGSRVDRLPILYTEKSEKESFDDMTDDVATSIMAYTSMANEYGKLDEILGMIENAKRVSARREIGQRTGSRRQQETISDETEIFHQPYTVKQGKTKIQQVLEDFLTMHFYGHVQKNEGTIPGTRISTRGLVNAANNLASYSQMALNLPQRISNITVGQAQIIIESAAKGMFSAKDVAYGAKTYLKYSGDRLMDTGKLDSDNKLSLFIEKFDLGQDNRRSFKQDKYGKSRFGRIFNLGLLYAGLTIGEDYLSTVSGLSLANRFKVKVGNETMNLFDAYEVKYADPVNKAGAYLKLRDGAVKEDGSPITKEDEYRFMKSVAGLNFDMQGIYNLDDRSAMQQYAGGALIIMYRKWIAPALKRRYAGVHYDTMREQWEQGYWNTTFNYLYDTYLSLKEDGEALKASILLNWDKLNDYEKSNIKKAVTEFCILMGTVISAATVTMLSSHGPDDDDKSMSWIEKEFLYYSLRLQNELGAMAPTPMLVEEAGKILKSPFAAARPIAAALDGLNLLVPTNYFTEVKSGKYKGHTKAYKYFRQLPIISMFGHWSKFINPDASIRYYQNPNF